MPLPPGTLTVETPIFPITVTLTPQEAAMLGWLAEQAGMVAADLLVDFVADLTSSFRNGGSDERAFAFNWFKRRGYTGGYIHQTEAVHWRSDVEDKLWPYRLRRRRGGVAGHPGCFRQFRQM